ncbi:hypothetical protein GGR57DRAFT_212422 [Xylariaceae sp. FL1272]|nr:hypothetical protein GGR57DRAFT_212422 [Xylariaceae sp. FL1272]
MMLFPIGRLATRRLALGTFCASRAVFVPRSAAFIYNPSARAFATTKEPKTAAKPKSAKPASTKKKAPAKSATPKKKAKKVVAKASKPKRKARAVSPEKKAENKLVADRKALKTLALLDEPKRQAPSRWIQFYTEKLNVRLKEMDSKPSIQTTAGLMREISEEFKTISASEKQRLDDVVEHNKLTTAAVHKAWVEAHAPQDICLANNARKLLKKNHNFPLKNALKPIPDGRLPTRPSTAMTWYNKARWASGELPSTNVAAVSQRIASEWRNLTPAEKQPYEDLAKASMERYHKEKMHTFGPDGRPRLKSALLDLQKAKKADKAAIA